MHQLYTLGYSGVKVDRLKQWLEDHDAILADVRISARSRQSEWNKGSLLRLMDERYYHIKTLGNRNYKGGPIEILDPSSGIEMVTHLLAQQPVVLMCQCWNLQECHRLTASKMIASALNITVIHLTKSDINSTKLASDPPNQKTLF